MTSACAPAVPARGALTPSELRQRFGTIAVTTGEPQVQGAFQQPLTSAKEAAAVGAGTGALETARAMAGSRMLLFLPLLGVLPLAVVGGAIAGAASVESPEAVMTGTAALNAAVNGLDCDPMLRNRLRDELARRGLYDVLFREPDAGESIRTLLRIGVTSVRLSETAAGAHGGSVNAHLFLHVAATVDVLERDGSGPPRLRASRVVSSTSAGGRRFREWTAHGAWAFKQGVWKELDELAKKIADVLLQVSVR